MAAQTPVQNRGFRIELHLVDERITVDDGNDPDDLAITGKLHLGAMGEEVFRQWMHFPVSAGQKKARTRNNRAGRITRCEKIQQGIENSIVHYWE
jgi:hypothetical protein